MSDGISFLALLLIVFAIGFAAGFSFSGDT